ncbi:hypothetical protein BJH90_19985 [Bacillus halotolerans]|nr:hypothetical protein BJH90_19985 [Bacillus halotolerans]
MFRWLDTDEKTAFHIIDEALDSGIPTNAGAEDIIIAKTIPTLLVWFLSDRPKEETLLYELYS